MLILGQNIIGEPTTVLFRKRLLTEPFGTLNGRNFPKVMQSILQGTFKFFPPSYGTEVHHKYLEGCEDFSHLVLHSKNMVSYKD